MLNSHPSLCSLVCGAGAGIEPALFSIGGFVTLIDLPMPAIDPSRHRIVDIAP